MKAQWGDEIVNFFKDNGTPLVDTTPRSLMEELEFYCKCGKVGKKRWYHFKRRPYCKKRSKYSKKEFYKWLSENVSD